MNDTEREAIILNSAWEMIDDMVNWAMFEKTDKTELSNLWFPTCQHRQLFLILLADFLSLPRAFLKGSLCLLASQTRRAIPPLQI